MNSCNLRVSFLSGVIVQNTLGVWIEKETLLPLINLNCLTFQSCFSQSPVTVAANEEGNEDEKRRLVDNGETPV